MTDMTYQTVHPKLANCIVGKLLLMYQASLPTTCFCALTPRSNCYGVPTEEVMNSKLASKASLLPSIHSTMLLTIAHHGTGEMAQHLGALAALAEDLALLPALAW